MTIAKKVKIAALIFMVAANLVYFLLLRERRTNVPAHMQPWQPLAQRTPEEREQAVASSLALDGFDIKPLAIESKFVMIPWPEIWWEQMVISTSFINVGPGKDEEDETTGDSTSADSKLPWRSGAINVKIISIAAKKYETKRTPGTERTPWPIRSSPETPIILMKERLISRDGYMSRNGIQVTLAEMVVNTRYFVNEKEHTLQRVQGAMMVNRIPRSTNMSDVPLWLLPKRKLALGETWMQLGALPRGTPDTTSRPKIVRTLNRLVMFEDRRAAEISSTSTLYDFSPGSEASHRKHETEDLVYLDLETGEPLWYESKDKDDPEFEAVVRGCNQIFTKHLIRTGKL